MNDQENQETKKDFDQLLEQLVEETTDALILPKAATARTISTSNGHYGPSLQTLNVSKFAKLLSLPLAGESQEAWIEFLVQCLAGAIFFKEQSYGNVGRIVKVICERLTKAGLAGASYFYIPYMDDQRNYSLQELSKVGGENLISTLLCWVSENILSNQEEIVKHPFIKKINEHRRAEGAKENISNFAAKGPFLTQVTKDVLAKALEQKRKYPPFIGEEDVIAFQNGVFRWSLFCEEKAVKEGVIDNVALIGLLGKHWKENPAGVSDKVNPEVSWLRYTNCLPLKFNFKKALEVLASEDGEKDTVFNGATVFKCPLFREFLEVPFPREWGTVKGILRMIGYCLLPTNPLQKYFYLEGIAGGGKGTLADLIYGLCGRRNATKAEIERIKNSDAWLGPCDGKRLVIIDEIGSGDNRSHQRLLAELARITGSEEIVTRSLYKDSQVTKSGIKFVLTTNTGFSFDDPYGQQERRVVPLAFRFKPLKVIESLAKRIAEEEGNDIGTLALIELMKGWYLGGNMWREGLGTDNDSAGFKLGREDFQQGSQGLLLFLNSVLERDKMVEYGMSEERLPASLLIKIVEIWLQGNEIHIHGTTAAKVKQSMMQLGYEEKRIRIKSADKTQVRGFEGCGLLLDNLLNGLEMDQKMFLKILHKKCAAKNQIWEFAKLALRGSIGEEDFQKVELSSHE